MNKTFRSFVEDQIQNEAGGISKSYAEFPVDFAPLANFLTFIPRTTHKARALSWITTAGLMQASKGRDQLLELVLQQVEQLSGSAMTMNPLRTMQNIPPSKAVVGEMARNPYGNWGRDVDDTEITAHDLFSPEAWERLPILKRVRLNGMGIHEYYRQNFEPKVMELDPEEQRGEKLRIDLFEMYEEIKERGLRPFEFGGFNGYIQYLEKGDWKEEWEKRAAISPNGQQGFNCSPEKRPVKDPTTGKVKLVDVDDLEGVNRRGKPVFNFAGGSSSPSVDRAKHVIHAMASQFHNIARAIETDDPLANADDEDIKRWKQILMARQFVHKQEQGLLDQGGGKGGVGNKLMLPRYDKGGPVRNPPPPGMDVGQFVELIGGGLDAPQKRNKRQIGNPEVFGPEVSDPSVAPAEGGWYCIQGDAIIYKLSDQQHADVLNFITATFKEDGLLNTNFYYTQIPSLAASKPGPNVKVNVSKCIDSAIKSDPQLLSSLKAVVYQMKGINYQRFINKQATGKKEVNPDPQANDPLIEKLLSSKFHWEINGPQDKEFENPLVPALRGVPGAKTKAFLTNNKHRYKVELDKDGKWYLSVPLDASDKAVKPSTHGGPGEAALFGAKGMRFGGGKMGGHLNMTAAGQKTYQALESRLLQGAAGGLAEVDRNDNGPFDNILELPCVKYGVQRAKSNFDGKHRNNKWFQVKGYRNPSDICEYMELLGFGAEHLPAMSNDRAFQVGLITKDEYKKLIGRKGGGKGRGDSSSGWDRDKKTDKGVAAMLRSTGVTDNDEAKDKDILDDIENYVLNGNGSEDGTLLIDKIYEIDEDVGRALAKNGYQWRATQIFRYVFSKLTQRMKEEMRNSPMTSLNAEKGEDGEGGDTDVVGSDHTDRRGDYEDSFDDFEDISPNKLAKIAGIETPPTATVGMSQRPRKPDMPALPTNSTPAVKPTEKPSIADRLDRLSSHIFGTPDIGVVKPQAAPRPQAAAPKSQPVVPQPQTQVSAPQSTQQALSPAAQARIQRLNTMASKFWEGRLNRATLDSIDEILDARLSSFKRWKRMQEMTATNAISINCTPRDGDGWNWEGAPGKAGGASISGDADTAKSDPTGKKGKKRGQRKSK